MSSELPFEAGRPGRLLGEFVHDLVDFVDRISRLEGPLLPASVSARFREVFLTSMYEAASSIARALSDDQPEVQLAAVGLTGAQLDFKLRGFYRARAGALEILERLGVSESPISRLPPARWRRRGRLRAWALSTLKWGNRILDSILQAFPLLPLGEMLKEGKEALEGLIEDQPLLRGRRSPSVDPRISDDDWF